MNGHGYGPSVDDYGVPPRSGIDPSGKVVVDSYRGDIINGFEQKAPVYNDVSPDGASESLRTDILDEP